VPKECAWVKAITSFQYVWANLSGDGSGIMPVN
jgi:hypothetical protein